MITVSRRNEATGPRRRSSLRAPPERASWLAGAASWSVTASLSHVVDLLPTTAAGVHGSSPARADGRHPA
jgi:hypothetical protein